MNIHTMRREMSDLSRNYVLSPDAKQLRTCGMDTLVIESKVGQEPSGLKWWGEKLK